MTDLNNQIGNSMRLLQQWYADQCDGDWELSFGIQIQTLDNPGWLVTVDLAETDWWEIRLDRVRVERSEYDWVQHEVVDSKFVGGGGINNLAEIINLFLEIVDLKK